MRARGDGVRDGFGWVEQKLKNAMLGDFSSRRAELVTFWGVYVYGHSNDTISLLHLDGRRRRPTSPIPFAGVHGDDEVVLHACEEPGSAAVMHERMWSPTPRREPLPSGEWKRRLETVAEVIVFRNTTKRQRPRQ